jgi:hypothetical protein
MKLFIQLLIIAVLIAVFASCTTTLYTSNTINAPLLKKKGEVQFTVTKNDAQGAVAVTDHVGIIANGFYRNYQNKTTRHYGQLAELGIGRYRTMFADHMVFENYFGLGYGKIYKEQEFMRPDMSTYIGSFKTNGAKIFMQPSLGFTSKIVDLAFTPRISMVKYMNFSSDIYPQDQLQNDYLTDNELTRLPYFLFDPAITLRVGYQYLKAQIQYGRTVNLGNRLQHNADFSSVGIVFNLGGYRYDHNSNSKKTKKQE